MSGYSIKTLGNQYVIHFNDCQDRDLAKRYVNAELAVPRKDLPDSGSDFYWNDLEGMKVINTEGVDYGVLDHIFETGANEVLVVKGDRERLIPYLKHVIQKVDMTAGIIVVDWDPEY